jgi:hypothetical protein
MHMRRIVLGIVPLLVFGPALLADDKAKDKDKDDKPAKAGDQTPADEYKALLKEVTQAQVEVAKPFRDAKTDAEREKIRAAYFKKPQEFTGRFLALAQKYPKDKVAYDALVYIILNGGESVGTDKAAELFLKDYEDKVEKTVELSRRAQSPAIAFLRTVAAKHSDHKIQGKALLALATALKNQAEAPDLTAAQKEKIKKEAEDTLTKVADKFADLKSVGDKAKGELFEMTRLVIGKEVPDIEGEDIDGKKFKLSDYRGKVVVLDFWGNW